MLVEITAADIANGEAKNCEKCVVANALARLNYPNGADTVKVDYRKVEWTKKKVISSLYNYDAVVATQRLPAEVTNYIRRFDRGETVVPTVFNISAPVEFV